LLKAIADINALEALCDLDVLDLVSVLSQPGLVEVLAVAAELAQDLFMRSSHED
jgi:tRNA A37 threonylcarbamoyltransferase TsaD